MQQLMKQKHTSWLNREHTRSADTLSTEQNWIFALNLSCNTLEAFSSVSYFASLVTIVLEVTRKKSANIFLFRISPAFQKMHLKNHPVTSKKNVLENVGHTQIDILARILAQARLDLEGSEKFFFFCSKISSRIYVISSNLNFQLDRSTLCHFV